MKRKRATTLQNLGPRYRAQTRSTSDPHQQNHPPLPSRTGRTLQIPQRTYSPRNHPTVQKPLRRILLLHQKEKRKTQACPRLSTSKCLDDQKPLPTSSHPLLNRLVTKLHKVYWGPHLMWIQRSTDQTRRPMESGVH